MNKTNAEEDSIQAVSPELIWAYASVDEKVIRKIERALIKTNPFFCNNINFIYIIVNLN